MMHDDQVSPPAKYEAKQLFHEAYRAQLAENYETAIELYKRSIETYPTAEAHTFLGWVYSFQERYDEAIAGASDYQRSVRVADIYGYIPVPPVVPHFPMPTGRMLGSDREAQIAYLRGEQAAAIQMAMTKRLPNASKLFASTKLSAIPTTTLAAISSAKVMLTAVCAGSNGRCWRLVMNRTPFRTSILAGFTKCVIVTLKQRDTMACR